MPQSWKKGIVRLSAESRYWGCFSFAYWLEEFFTATGNGSLHFSMRIGRGKRDRKSTIVSEIPILQWFHWVILGFSMVIRRTG